VLVDIDTGALGQEPLRDRAADALCGAGDNGGFSLEAHGQ
jgi:hypothetical protein